MKIHEHMWTFMYDIIIWKSMEIPSGNIGRTIENRNAMGKPKGYPWCISSVFSTRDVHEDVIISCRLS